MKLPAWTREPLVHFLVGGGLLFAWFAWQGNPVDPASRSIVIGPAELGNIAKGFERQMGRAPTDGELDNLIESAVREEVLYREALRLGLDQDDAVVRRRLAQKMDLIAASQAEVAVPSDAVLEKWLADHPARFAGDASYTFEQLYYAERPAADLALKNADLAAKVEMDTARSDIPVRVSGTSRPEVLARFGQQFVREIEQLEAGEGWQGPVPSGLGWHLVRLTQVSASQTPKLSDIRTRVEDDWRLATGAKREQAAYQTLRDAYTVEIAR